MTLSGGNQKAKAGKTPKEIELPIYPTTPDFYREQSKYCRALSFILTFKKPAVIMMFPKPVSSQAFPSASNCPLYHRLYQVNGVPPPLGLLKGDAQDLSGNVSQSWHGGPLVLHSCKRVTVNYVICQEVPSRAVWPDAPTLHMRKAFRMWLEMGLKTLKGTKSLCPQQQQRKMIPHHALYSLMTLNNLFLRWRKSCCLAVGTCSRF